MVTDAATAQNEIIGNKADWTWNVIPDMVDKLGALPYLKTERAETMRVNLLNLDAAGRSGAGNPLTKQKVRQAIIHAIDRASIAKNLMQGDSRVLRRRASRPSLAAMRPRRSIIPTIPPRRAHCSPKPAIRMA